MVEWPGWPLANNKYGAEFDEDARIRMIIGSRKLIPYIIKYRKSLGHSLLEIGPFFNPLLKHEELCDLLENRAITFLENDPMAISWLAQHYQCRILDIDMNSEIFPQDLNEQINREATGYRNTFNTVIISQALNYIDHLHLLRSLLPLLEPGGLLLINNVINYGIPALFSPKRPRSNRSIIEAAIESGYSILERNTIPKHFANEPQRRMILILTKPS